jgi:hypothetical protein
MAGLSDENKLAQDLLLQMKDYTPTVRLPCCESFPPHSPAAPLLPKSPASVAVRVRLTGCPTPRNRYRTR